MGIYFEFARKSFRQNAVYKADVLLGVFSHFLYLFLQISVWTVLFSTRPSGTPISLRQMITYIILCEFIVPLTRCSIDHRIAERVDDGSIGNDFIRPVNFKYYMIADDFGDHIFMALYQMLPACLFAILFWGLQLPKDPLSGVLAVLLLAGGVVVNTYLNYCIGLLSFWFQTRYHVDWLFYALRSLFSGGMVPLWFYPPALRIFSELLPWQLARFAPLNIFLETAPAGYVARILVSEMVWFGILVLVERRLWRMATEKVEVYGG